MNGYDGMKLVGEGKDAKTQPVKEYKQENSSSLMMRICMNILRLPIIPRRLTFHIFGEYRQFRKKP